MDVTEEWIGQALPTVTGVAARLAIAVLKKHSVAIAPLLRHAGLSERDFDSRQHRISAASQGKFLEYAAEAMDDSAFGLHLAEEANPREVGLLFYVTSAAYNIGEALTLFARYSRIVNEAARIKLVRAPEGVVAEIAFVGPPGTGRSRLPNLALPPQSRRCERSRVGIFIRRTQASSTDETLTCGRSSGSSVAQSSLAHCSINSHSPMRRWRSRLSPKIDTCSRRSSPFAMRLQKSAALRSGRSEPWLRTRSKGCSLTARRGEKTSPRHWASASERSRANWPARVQLTSRSSISCGKASRSNI